MTYAICGLPPARFAHLFCLSDAELADRHAVRVTASSSSGFPCRISLEDAAAGDTLILLPHVSHDVATPFRSAFAIFVRDVAAAPVYIDRVPPVMVSRTLGLRGFDHAGMLRDARLSMPGEADAGIRTLFDNPAIAYVQAHNAAHGCFLAQVERA